jgi:hypothetical protein
MSALRCRLALELGELGLELLVALRDLEVALLLVVPISA